MRGKFKWLLGFSIGLNITLIVYLMSDYTNRQEVKETVLFLEVYDNLEELEGTIANQIDTQWTEPMLVTKQLEETISGFYLSGTTSQQLGILSNEEDEIINNIYLKFNNYLSGYGDLTEQNKKDFELLRQMIYEVGIGTDSEKEEPKNGTRDIMDKLKKLSSRIN